MGWEPPDRRASGAWRRGYNGGVPDPADAHTQALLKVADAIGALMEFWGFRRNMGRLWALLYLSPEPLSAADISDKLSLSAGAVSMTLGELQGWGAVKKSWVPGERRDYYEPETSIWKMVSRVFRERELRQIEGAIEAFQGTMSSIKSGEDPKASSRETFAKERIARLLELAEVGKALLEAVLSGESVDALPLVQFTDRNKQ